MDGLDLYRLINSARGAIKPNFPCLEPPVLQKGCGPAVKVGLGREQKDPGCNGLPDPVPGEKSLSSKGVSIASGAVVCTGISPPRF